MPLLAASLAGYFDWYHFPQELGWIESLPALICFAVAAVLEIAAYYIPFIDNLLDSIATPLSVAAGTLLAASILPSGGQESLWHWALALIAGGGTAGTIQLGSGLLRLLSTKTTAGSGNMVVASGENIAAVGGSLLSFLIPLATCIILLGIVMYLLYRIIKRFTAL